PSTDHWRDILPGFHASGDHPPGLSSGQSTGKQPASGRGGQLPAPENKGSCQPLSASLPASHGRQESFLSPRVDRDENREGQMMVEALLQRRRDQRGDEPSGSFLAPDQTPGKEEQVGRPFSQPPSEIRKPFLTKRHIHPHVVPLAC